MKTVYLSLGSNLGDRQRQIEEALERLTQAEVRIGARSSFYETEPRDVRSQPWFLNLAVKAETRLFPLQLLGTIGRIEREMGRKRLLANGPRNIDIDILLYGNFVVETRDLTVPHPRLAERRFVLEPLAEIAPDLRHPVSRKSVKEMLAGLAGQAVRKWQPPV